VRLEVCCGWERELYENATGSVGLQLSILWGNISAGFFMALCMYVCIFLELT
jgi:hypothetical protein